MWIVRPMEVAIFIQNLRKNIPALTIKSFHRSDEILHVMKKNKVKGIPMGRTQGFIFYCMPLINTKESQWNI